MIYACVVYNSMCIIMSCIMLCAGLVPYDGVPEKKIETVHISITVVFIVLACCGMVFAVVCITFNFVYRKSKYVRTCVQVASIMKLLQV